jgi:hypothetical protein
MSKCRCNFLWNKKYYDILVVIYMLCILYNYNLNQTGSEYYSETSLIRTLLGPTFVFEIYRCSVYTGCRFIQGLVKTIFTVLHLFSSSQPFLALLNLLFVLKFQNDQSNRTLAIVKKFPCRQKTKTSPYHNTIFSHITRDSSESVSLTWYSFPVCVQMKSRFR